MNDRTTGIGTDAKISIGRYRYSLILASIGRYPIPDTGLTLTPTIPPSYIRVRAVVWKWCERQTHRRTWPIYISHRLRLTWNV